MRIRHAENPGFARLRQAAAALLLSGLWTAPVSGQERFDVKAFLARYVELHRGHDLAGLMALHTPDAEFLLPGQDPIHGETALRSLFEWDAALGSELEIADARLEGDALVLGAIVERNALFAALGIEAVRYRPGTRLQLERGLIASTAPAPFEPESEAAVVAGIGALVGWLEERHPELVAELLPGGKFRYDADSARCWLGALALWRTERDGGPPSAG